mgnify:CR=1 FL=1
MVVLSLYKSKHIHIMTTRVTELLDKTGLNWNVRTEGITTESGIILDGYKAIVRDDTNTALSVRSDEYYPFQNHELVELLDKVSGQTGLEIRSGGFPPSNRDREYGIPCYFSRSAEFQNGRQK